MKKSGRLYGLILLVWCVCDLFLLGYLWRECRAAEQPLVCLLLAMC